MNSSMSGCPSVGHSSYPYQEPHVLPCETSSESIRKANYIDQSPRLPYDDGFEEYFQICDHHVEDQTRVRAVGSSSMVNEVDATVVPDETVLRQQLQTDVATGLPSRHSLTPSRRTPAASHHVPVVPAWFVCAAFASCVVCSAGLFISSFMVGSVPELSSYGSDSVDACDFVGQSAIGTTYRYMTVFAIAFVSSLLLEKDALNSSILMGF